MSIEKVRDYLKEVGLEDRIIEFNDSIATVKEAANKLKCDEKDIAKTLSFIVNDNPILIVVSGDSRINNSKYKKEFYIKAKMIPYDDVERLIGHKAGGVCPIAVNDNVKIYFDESLKKLDVLYPAAGSKNSAIKLTLCELESILNDIKWIDVCE